LSLKQMVSLGEKENTFPGENVDIRKPIMGACKTTNLKGLVVNQGGVLNPESKERGAGARGTVLFVCPRLGGMGLLEKATATRAGLRRKKRRRK